MRAAFGSSKGTRHLKLGEGSGTSSRRFAGLDERNSVISATDASGTLVGINAYDEYGRPGAANIGRMQYTGQMWLPEANVTYSKARNYLPGLGVFAQTDPIGPADDANLYAYTGNDPVNASDPTGLVVPIVVTGQRLTCSDVCFAIDSSLIAAWFFSPGVANNGASVAGGSSIPATTTDLTPAKINSIVITGYRRRIFGGIRINFDLAYPQEQLWVIYPDGSVVFIPTTATDVNDEARNEGTAPRLGWVATAHTHTFEIGGPGSHDFGQLVPVYIFAPNGVYVIMPGSRQAKYLGR